MGHIKDKICVIIESQEQLDRVISFLNVDWVVDYKTMKESYPDEPVCKSLCTPNWSKVAYYNNYEKSYTIISFQEFERDYLSKKEDKPVDRVEVFPGIYVGDIVVSLKHRESCRTVGDLFKVLGSSYRNTLYYQTSINNDEPSEWKKATPEEVEAYNQGIRNIKDIKPKERVVNTHGLSVGMNIPQDVLNAWCKKDDNEFDLANSKKSWHKFGSHYSSNRTIVKFDVYDGVDGFHPSGVHNNELVVRAEGFLDFMNNFNKPKEEVKFKKGDWIYTLPHSNGWGMSPSDVDKVFRVEDVETDEEFVKLKLDKSSCPTAVTQGTIRVRVRDIRAAYPHEISKEQTTNFKVGDWVYVLTTDKNGYKKVGDVFQAVKVEVTSWGEEQVWFAEGKSVIKDRLRLATSQEIAKAKGLVDKPVITTNFQVGDFITWNNCDGDSYEISKINGDKLSVIYKGLDYNYSFSQLKDLRLVKRGNLVDKGSRWEYEIKKEVVDKYPRTIKESYQQLEHQQPILIKQVKPKKGLLVV